MDTTGKDDTTLSNGFTAAQRPRLSPASCLLNVFGRGLGALGLSLCRGSADTLMAATSRRAHVSDWGEETFREGLEELVGSLRRDADLSITGWLIMRRRLSGYLYNRLMVRDAVKKNPGILRETIQKPVFILGLPRTGSTFLHELFHCDRNIRALLAWEVSKPIAAAEGNTQDVDSRIAEVEAGIEGFFRLVPHSRQIHDISARGPDEDLPWLESSFTFPSFHSSARVDSYDNWLSDRKQNVTYSYYRTCLQTLQFGHEANRWVLKCPWHLYALDALLSTFPDALIIQTHRDPVEVIASMASLTATARSIFSNRVDPVEVGRQCVGDWQTFLKRGLGVRSAATGTRFVDVFYEDLVRHPLNTMRSVYGSLDWAFDEGLEQQLAAKVSKMSQKKRGIHKYNLEQFGLDSSAVRSAFEFYYDAFPFPSGTGEQRKEDVLT